MVARRIPPPGQTGDCCWNQHTSWQLLQQSAGQDEEDFHIFLLPGPNPKSAQFRSNFIMEEN
jgi:hypothetical protein